MKGSIQFKDSVSEHSCCRDREVGRGGWFRERARARVCVCVCVCVNFTTLTRV